MVVPASGPFAVATPSGTLSTAAQAGIGIGAAAVGLAFVALGFAWMVWRRRGHRRKDGQKKEDGDGGVAVPVQQASLGGSSFTDEPGPSWGYKSELSAEPRHVHRVELPADEVMVSMPHIAEQSVGEELELGPVSPLSGSGDSMLDRRMSGTVSDVESLSPLSQRLLDSTEVDDGGLVGEDDVRLSEERRYGEGTRLEAIPELQTE